jgi:hypothetical protein
MGGADWTGDALLHPLSNLSPRPGKSHFRGEWRRGHSARADLTHTVDIPLQERMKTPPVTGSVSISTSSSDASQQSDEPSAFFLRSNHHLVFAMSSLLVSPRQIPKPLIHGSSK